MKLFYLVASMILFLQSCVTSPQIASFPDAKIVEISSMAELKAFVRSETLVLFDLDHTVFEGAQIYGHANWFYGVIDEAKKEGISPDETIKKIFPVWLRSQERASMKPVEALTPALIKDLQARGIKVMGLTARQTPLIPATLRQLAELDIDFRKTSLNPAIFGDKEFAAPVAFSNGILFTSEFVKKSAVLKAYLDRIAFRPQHIVFVDDSKKHVEDLVQTFQAMGLSISGLHYPIVEARRSAWDQNEALKIYQECDEDEFKQKALCGQKS